MQILSKNQFQCDSNWSPTERSERKDYRLSEHIALQLAITPCLLTEILESAL